MAMATPSPDPAPSPEQTPYAHYIFISYSRKDSRVARWLQRRLEFFRFPVQLVPQEKRPGHSKFLRPIYRDKTHLEVDDAHYWQNIRHALESSRYLVVLCSPDSATSGPVDQEVRHFLATHPAESAIASVVPIIVRGKVASGDSEECLCPALKELGKKITERNLPTLIPDGDDSEKEGWENGFIGLVAYLLHLKREELSDHVRREERKKALFARSLAALFAVLAIAACITGYLAYQNALEAQTQRQVAEEQKQEAERQKDLVTQKSEEQDKLLLSASQGDHEAALRAIDEGRNSDALAYFHRALKSYPKNTAALAASVNFAIGPSSPGFLTRTVIKFKGEVNAISFSPNGHWVAGGSNDRTLRLVEAASGKEAWHVKLEAAVNDLGFSPDGRWLVTSHGMGKGILQVLDASSGKEVSRALFEEPIGSISFSSDGHRLAVCSGTLIKKTLEVVETATGKEVCQVKAEDEISHVTFSPEGRWIAAIIDGSLRLVETITGKVISLAKLEDGVGDVKFSPDGKWITIAGRFDHILRLLEVTTGKEVSQVRFAEGFSKVRFGPSGAWLATIGGADNTLRVVSVATGKEVSHVKFDGSVSNVNFSPDERWIAAIVGNSTLRLVETVTGKEVAKLNFEGNISSVSFSPDGRWLAAGSADQTLRVVETATYKDASQARLDDNTSTVSYSQDGRWIAVGRADQTLRVIESTTGRQASRTHLEGEIFSLNFSPDSRWLAAGYGKWDNARLQVVECATGREVYRIKFEDAVRSLSFSPDGRWLATGSFDTLRVLETATGKETSQVKFESSVCSANFSPNGRWLVIGTGHHSGLGDTSLRVLEAASGSEIFRMQGPGKNCAITFSPDGRWLAVGLRGGQLRVVETATGKEISRCLFEGHANSVCFSPDGRSIAVGSNDQTLRVIESATGTEISRTIFESAIFSVDFSPDGRWIAAGDGRQSDKKGTLRVVEASTGKEVCRMRFEGAVSTVHFSRDGRWISFVTGGTSLRLTPTYGLSETEKAMNENWLAFLSFQSGTTLRNFGRMTLLEPEEMQSLSEKLHHPSITTKSSSQSGSQGSKTVIEYFRTPPEHRTVPLWQETYLWQEIGQRLSEVAAYETQSIRTLTDSAPWHPLTPISLARIERTNPSPTNEEKSSPLNYLAQLSLKRITQPNQSPYEQDALIQYHSKVAEWMVADLDLTEAGFKELDSLLLQHPNSSYPIRAKAKAFESILKPKEALPLYQQLWKQPDALVEDFTTGGCIAAELQNKETTSQAYALAPERFPDDESIPRTEGWSRLMLNEADLAMKAFERCLQINTKSVRSPDKDLLIGLIIAHWLNQSHEKAIEYHKALIETDITWLFPETVLSGNRPKTESEPLLESLAATLKKHPNLAPQSKSDAKFEQK